MVELYTRQLNITLCEIKVHETGPCPYCHPPGNSDLYRVPRHCDVGVALERKRSMLQTLLASAERAAG